jgi:hypothetical protein
MKLAVMQPYIFPYLGYFQLVNLVDTFVFYDDVNYIKKGWINRNQTLGNGQAQLFTIPLENASQNRLIKDIELLEDPKWKLKFLKGLEQSYKKAPFFNEGFALVKETFEADAKTISELCQLSIIRVAEYLELDTKFKVSSDQYHNQDLKAQIRILDICKKEGADHYINPIGGQEIYDKTLFERENIKMDFIASEKIVYEQFDKDFVPYLSMIDCLMFLDKDQIRGELNKFKLV